MKIIYEFDTDKDSFDRAEFETYKQSELLRTALMKITDLVKYWVKYDKRETIPADEIHKKVWDIIRENYINLDVMM